MHFNCQYIVYNYILRTMKLSAILIPFLLLGSRNVLALASEDHQDMSMQNEVHHDSTTTSMASKNNTNALEPVPHRDHHHHGVPILQTDLYPEERAFWEAYNTTSFLTIKNSNKGALAGHIVLTTLIIFFFYPITLVLNNVGSNWYLPALTVNLLATLAALLCLAIFGGSVPNLYPKNAYTRMSYILFVSIIVHYVSAIFAYAEKWLSQENQVDEYNTYVPLRDYGHERGSSSVSPSSTLYDFNNNSSDSHHNHSSSKNFSIDSPRFSDAQHYRNSEATVERLSEVGEEDTFEIESQHDNETANSNQVHFSDNINDAENAGLINSDYIMETKKNKIFKTAASKRDGLYQKFNSKFIKSFLHRFGKFSSFIFNFLNYSLFGFFLVYGPTGVAVANLMGQGVKVFNLLAHFIKGGVFFLLGLVSLARYCGCWNEQGLAWNAVKFNSSEKQQNKHFLIRRGPKGLFTMEFIESFLIFFYGSTNVFLEHLSNPGGEWAAKDLQHASIAFMYIGGGLGGLLTEFGLSEWRFRRVMESYDNNRHPNKQIQYASPGFSPNPFPAFTIFWTGILMSQHAQASATSTKIHMQWGYMLSYGALFRLLTYVICQFTKPSKYEAKSSIHKPMKPLTELIVSSALLAGGLIFMESTDQCVNALEYRGLTPMFTLNVSVGVCALLMGWEMTLLFWKDWLKQRS